MSELTRFAVMWLRTQPIVMQQLLQSSPVYEPPLKCRCSRTMRWSVQ